MLEVAGDSTRGSDWACVRLVLDGDLIVDADADGLEASLVGLTLLEAAAVPGERLVVDALANALGPVFTAAADPERIAVAMSGGVDSAVALLRAGPAAIGVTLRLWIDPDLGLVFVFFTNEWDADRGPELAALRALYQAVS